MPRNMKSPMMSTHFLTSFCVVLGFLAIAAQARTLPESPHNKFKLIITYGRTLSPPPPSPTTSPPTKEVTSISTCTSETQCNNFIDKTNYGRPFISPPPAPKAAPPTHYITTNYGRDRSPPPPTPVPSSPTGHLEIASPCVAGSQCDVIISTITNYGKIFKSPPPPPKPSSPTHQVTSDEQLVDRRSPPDFYLASS